jgi:hypothetical protein
VSRHECDCGAVYTCLESLYRCQGRGHGRKYASGKINPRSVKCPYCWAIVGEFCKGWRAFGNTPQYHTSRWRAAEEIK